jgi:hypothetical protein
MNGMPYFGGAPLAAAPVYASTLSPPPTYSTVSYGPAIVVGEASKPSQAPVSAPKKSAIDELLYKGLVASQVFTFCAYAVVSAGAGESSSVRMRGCRVDW